jgi:hypothetical protein
MLIMHYAIKVHQQSLACLFNLFGAHNCSEWAEINNEQFENAIHSVCATSAVRAI